MPSKYLNFFLFLCCSSYLGPVIALADDANCDEFAPVAGILKSCEVCHGEGGASTQQQYPILAGQEFYYLYVQLKDFKSGLRADPIMGPLSSALDKESMQLIAKYFSAQEWRDTEYMNQEQATQTAKSVITAGQCVACHLGAFHGNSRVPRLAGQHPEYLAKTMLDFKSKARQNSPAKGSLLASFADQELVDVAEYLSSL
ncbi:MAG: hypothetical protein OER97_05080 [Gammaproteobacteria bacterium]|nr:hypothetical protein [Gammaproteobacteria bacterium]